MAIRNDLNPTSNLGAPSSPATSAEPPPLDPAKLPKTAEGARALAQGARFEVWGKDAGGGARLDLRKLDGNQVEVAVDGSKKGDKKTYVLDLSNPSAQRAYEELVKFKTTSAAMMAAEPKKTGVSEGEAKNTLVVKASGGFKTDKKADEEAGTKEITRTANGQVTANKGNVTGTAHLQFQQKGVTTPDGKTDTLQAQGGVRGQHATTHGEQTAQLGAGVVGTYTQTTSKDAQGNTTQVVKDRNVVGKADVGLSDTTGPFQSNVSASHQLGVGQTKTTVPGKGTTVTDYQTSQTQLGANGQVTTGEATLQAGATHQDSSKDTRSRGPDGGLTTTAEQGKVTTLSGGVADKTGDLQYGVSGKHQENQSTKVTTDPKGQVTTVVTDGSKQNAAANAQVTSGNTTVGAGATYEQKQSTVTTTGPGGTTVREEQGKTGTVNASAAHTAGENALSAQGGVTRGQNVVTTTGPDGKVTTVTTDTRGLTAAAGIVDETGPNQHRANAGLEKNQVVVTTVGPDGKTQTQSDLTGKATVGAGVTRGEVSVGADYVRTWQEVRAADGRNLRTASGTLKNELDLTSSFKGGKVGFERDTAKEYTFTLPPGSTGSPALPTTAIAQQGLYEGSTFTLKSTGRFGVSGEAKGFTAGVSSDRTVEIKTERGPANVVHVSVDFRAQRGNQQGYAGTFGDKEGLNVTVGASRNEVDIENRVDQFTFDLAKTEHRQAYDALMRGNLGPAQQLGPAAQSTRTSTTGMQGKVGVAYSDKVGASIELRRKDLDPSDPRIQGDALRKSTTDALQTQGRDVRWIERAGAFELGGGHGVSVPVGGPISVSFGFDAKKTLEWRSMGPRADGQGGAPGVATDAEDAYAMTPGSEFQIRGTGVVSGRAGIAAGWTGGPAGVQVTAGVGVTATKGRQVEMNVEVRKLDATTVQVRLDELTQTSKGREFAARLGLHVSGAELAAGGGSLVAALAKKPDLAAKLAGIEQSLSAEFAIGQEKTQTVGNGLTFTLDLTKPEARGAYEALVRGNPETALDLASAQGSGVALRNTTTGTSQQTEKSINAQIGKTVLYSSSEVRKDATIEVTQDARSERLDHSIADKKQESIWGRDRSVGVEAVSLRTPEAPNGTRYFRLSFQEKDRFTSEGELRARTDLATALGAVPANPIRIEADKKEGRGFVGFITGARNDYGKLKTDIEVFITDAGIQKIRGHDRVGAINAYGQVLADKNGGNTPNWAHPHFGEWSRNILDTYRNAKDTGTRDAYRKAYEDQFGEEAFKQDAKEYARADDFARAIEQGRRDDDPAAWNKAFADHARRAGFNFFDGLAAMNKMAGPDQVLVNKFTVKGKAVDIEMVSEGSLAAPEISAHMQHQPAK